MPVTEIESVARLREHLGQEVAVSEWLEVTQERINQFAEATEDRQWIHVDPERAARESPFKTTIAHGFLTLSLLSRLAMQTMSVGRVRMGINYGLNRVRFPAPVPVGSRVRATFELLSVEDIEGDGVQVVTKVTIEREGGGKPVCVAETVSRSYS